jgi:hypothetical protein
VAPEFPLALIAACVLALPLTPVIGRAIFGRREDFYDDLGVRDPEGRARLLVELLTLYFYLPMRGVYFSLLVFFTVYAAAVGGLYQLFSLLLRRFV